LFGNIWNDPWEGVDYPARLYDQHFGSIVPDDFFRTGGRRGWPMMPPMETGRSEVVNNDKEFKVCMDVQHFKPEEIKITSKDNRVSINARHEERPDEHGFIMREFTRSYVLPKDVDPKQVTSSLNSHGVLTLKAPKLALEAPKEQTIPIKMDTGDA
jgi:crystallin alpha B